MLNLGVSFRNSKWAGYARKNVSLKLSESYLRFIKNIGGILFFFFSIIFLTNYYNFSPFWFLSDSFFSTGLYLYFSLIFTPQYLIYQVYQTFYLTALPTKLSWNQNFGKYKQSISKEVETSSYNSKLVIYGWLRSAGVREGSEFFSFTTKEVLNTKSFKLTTSFYQLLYPLSLVNNVKTIKINPSLKNVQKSYELADKNINCFSPGLLHFYLTQQEPSFSDNGKVRLQTQLEDNRWKWNLYNLTATNSSYEKVLPESFYVSQIALNEWNSLITNFNEGVTLNATLRERENIIRRGSWLYKYTTLNKTILKHTQNLRLVKQNLGLGFYNLRIDHNNLWASNELKSNTRFYQYSKNFYQHNNLSWTSRMFLDSKNILSNPQHNDKLTKFYEDSYFWFFKRSYLFNSSDSNFTNSTYKAFKKLDLEEGEVQGVTRKFLINGRVISTTLLSSPTLLNKPFVPKMFSIQMNNEGLHNFTETLNNERDLLLTYNQKNAYTNSTSDILSALLQTSAYTTRTFTYILNNNSRLINNPARTLSLSKLPDHVQVIKYYVDSTNSNLSVNYSKSARTTHLVKSLTYPRIKVTSNHLKNEKILLLDVLLLNYIKNK